MTDAPILINLSGATFLMTTETGGLIQSFSATVRRKRIDVYDASVGYTSGKIFHDPVAEYSVRVVKTGSAGVSAAAPGVAVTLANSIGTSNGAPGGTVYTETVTHSHNAEGLRELTVTAVQHAV